MTRRPVAASKDRRARTRRPSGVAVGGKIAGGNASGGRERLVRAATRLFAAKGYAATTVRDIVKAAGVTAPALYYHFGNKEGVFLALAREAADRFDSALERAVGESGTASGRIRAYCRAAVAVRREYVDLTRIVDGILSGPPEAAPRFDFRERITVFFRRLEGFVRQGIESGEFRECDTGSAALALMGAIEVAARPHVYGPGMVAAEEQLDGMLSMILRGLAPAAGARRPGRGQRPRRANQSRRALDSGG